MIGDVELKIWPLDATYTVVGGVLEVRIFGISESLERVVVVDRFFKPYFYLEFPVCDAAAVKASLSRVAPVEAVGRKFLGRPKRFLKAVAKIPEDVGKLREAALAVPGVSSVY